MHWRKIIPFLIIGLFFSCKEKEVVPPPVVHVPFLKNNSAWADSLIQTMSVEEKLGQLIVLQTSLPDSLNRDSFYQWVAEGKIGGYLLDSLPLENFLAVQDSCKQLSTVPLFSGTDQKVLLNNQFTDLPVFPKLASISAIQSDSIEQLIEQVFIQQIKKTGINFSLAPSIAVHQDTTEQSFNFHAYSDKKEKVYEIAQRLMNKLQEKNILSFADSYKDYIHIPNDTSGITQQQLAHLTQLVEEGLSGIVLDSHLASLDTFDRRPIGFIQNYLEQQVGFNGLLIGKATSNFSIKKQLRAGADLFIINKELKSTSQQLQSAMQEGILTEASLNAKVTKVLMAKSWLGLDTLQETNTQNLAVQTSYKPKNYKDLKDQIANKHHAYWAKTLFESSIILASNQTSNKSEPTPLLPFQNINKNNYRIFHYGKEHLKKFKTTFFKFATYTSQLVPPDKETGALKIFPQRRLRKSTVIITLDQLNIDSTRDSIFIKSIQDLKQKMPVVLINYGNPYNLQYFDSTLVAIQIFERNDHTEALSAQLLFGSLSANGSLPLHVADHLPFGKSNATDIIRLKYVTPEEVGIAPQKLVGIEAYARGAISARATPGCQVLVAKNGKIFYSRAFGHHSFDKKRKVKTSDLYDIASITKVASTTLAGMRLFEQGKYKINDRLKQHLDLPAKSTIKNEKIKYLLVHRSRLQANMPVGKYIRYQDTTTQLDSNLYFSKVLHKDYKIQVADSMFFSKVQLDTMWMNIEKLKLRRSTRYRYSDVNFNLLQKIFEKASGKPLDRYVYQNFYNPLNIRRTFYNPLDRIGKNQIAPTQDDKKFRNQLLQGYVHDESAALMGGVAGNAGLFSNAEDLAVIFQMLLNKGVYGGQRFFKEKTVTYFTSSQHGNHRSLGFDRPRKRRMPSVARSASLETYGHTGFTGTCVWVDPKEDLVFIFLSNRIHPDVRNRKLFRKKIRGAIHQVVYDALNTYEMEILEEEPIPSTEVPARISKR